jgi:hypothetical protein
VNFIVPKFSYSPLNALAYTMTKIYKVLPQYSISPTQNNHSTDPYAGRH